VRERFTFARRSDFSFAFRLPFFPSLMSPSRQQGEHKQSRKKLLHYIHSPVYFPPVLRPFQRCSCGWTDFPLADASFAFPLRGDGRTLRLVMERKRGEGISQIKFYVPRAGSEATRLALNMMKDDDDDEGLMQFPSFHEAPRVVPSVSIKYLLPLAPCIGETSSLAQHITPPPSVRLLCSSSTFPGRSKFNSSSGLIALQHEYFRRRQAANGAGRQLVPSIKVTKKSEASKWMWKGGRPHEIFTSASAHYANLITFRSCIGQSG
jgi:hypothetical protein